MGSARELYWLEISCDKTIQERSSQIVFEIKVSFMNVYLKILKIGITGAHGKHSSSIRAPLEMAGHVPTWMTPGRTVRGC